MGCLGATRLCPAEALACVFVRARCTLVRRRTCSRPKGEEKRTAGRRYLEKWASVEPPDSTDKPPNGVPDWVKDRARATFDQRTPGELARLRFDSLLDEGASPGDHRLRFEHPALEIDVDVSVAAESTTLTGTVKPSGPHRVELQLERSEVPLINDAEEGTFNFEDLPHGLVRLWVSGSLQTPAIRTDWFRV